MKVFVINNRYEYYMQCNEKDKILSRQFSFEKFIYNIICYILKNSVNVTVTTTAIEYIFNISIEINLFIMQYPPSILVLVSIHNYYHGTLKQKTSAKDVSIFYLGLQTPQGSYPIFSASSIVSNQISFSFNIFSAHLQVGL